MATQVNVCSEFTSVGKKLLVTLRDQLQPEESTREESEQYEKIKKLKYRGFKDDWACEVVEGIPVKDFGKYLADLQKKYNLPDEAKKLLEDAFCGKHGDCEKFHLSKKCEIKMFSMKCIVAKQNDKIDLVFATYNLYFKIHHTTFSMTDEMKNAFRKFYQEKLYKKVDQKCK